MEKENESLSILSSSNYSVSSNISTQNINNSLYSAHPSTSIFDSADNFQHHNPYLKRPNHMQIKMFGKINGQPITQNQYKLQTFIKEEGSKGEMEKLLIQNKELSLKIKMLEQTIIKIKNEKSNNSREENYKQQIKNITVLKSKLSQKQQHNSILLQSFTKQKQFANSLESQLRNSKENIRKVQYQLICCKEERNRLTIQYNQLRKTNEQIMTRMRNQAQQILVLKNYKKYKESVPPELQAQKQQLLKLQKQNQILRNNFFELSKTQSKPNIQSKLLQIKDLNIRNYKLQQMAKINESVTASTNQDIIKQKIRVLNQKFKNFSFD